MSKSKKASEKEEAREAVEASAACQHLAVAEARSAACALIASRTAWLLINRVPPAVAREDSALETA